MMIHQCEDAVLSTFENERLHVKDHYRGHTFILWGAAHNQYPEVFARTASPGPRKQWEYLEVRDLAVEFKGNLIPFIIIYEVLLNDVKLSKLLWIATDHKDVLVDDDRRAPISSCWHWCYWKPAVPQDIELFTFRKISCSISPSKYKQRIIVVVMNCRKKCSRASHTCFADELIVLLEVEHLIGVLLAVLQLPSQ